MATSRLVVYIIITVATLLMAGCGLIGFVGSAEEEATDMDGELPEWLFWSHYDIADPLDDNLLSDEEGSSVNDGSIAQGTGSTAPVTAPAPFPVTDPEPEQKVQPVVPSGGGHKPGTMEYIIWLHEQKKGAQKEQEAPATERKDWWE